MDSLRLSVHFPQAVLQVILALMLASSCDAQELPGSKGPRVENLAAPPSGMELLWVCVIDDEDFSIIGDTPSQTIREKPLSQKMKSGVKRLLFAMDFKQPLPNGTRIAVEISSMDGPVKLSGFGATETARAPSGEFRVQMGRQPETGVFVDGDYQAVLTINDTAFARLNWSIGK